MHRESSITPTGAHQTEERRHPERRAPAAAAAPSVAYATEMQATIAGIWQSALGVGHIEPRDNFFDLGGHSLLAVQTHRRLKEALQRELSITDIFRFPVLSALAKHLDDTPKPAAEPVALAHDRAEARSDAMARRLAMRARREEA